MKKLAVFLMVIILYCGIAANAEALSAESGGSGGNYGAGSAAIALIFFVLIALRGWRIGATYNKRYTAVKPYMRRRARTRPPVRLDDGDIPSGFGGPGSINDVIYKDTDEKGDE